MRVISGALGGRKFYPPHNLPTRPTTDFAKTGLFNILNNNFDFGEISVLDLFSGTGNISYEFASRGAERIVSVDKDNGAADFIRKMKKEWGLIMIDVHKSDVFRFLQYNTESFDVIFAGPPYALNNIDDLPDIVLEKGILNKDGWFILETSPKHQFNEHPHLIQVRNYGQTHFHFFSGDKKEPVSNENSPDK